MASYELFGSKALNLPINPVEAPADFKHNYISPQRKEAEDYLDRMIMEGKLIPAIPQNNQVETTTEKETIRVREKIEKWLHSCVISESEDPVVTLTEKIFVPAIPQHNFVGRLLGPGGSHVQRLQEATGCTIQVRGRGSLKNRNWEEFMKKSPGMEHLKEELHVIIQCEDKEQRCRQKMAKARQHVKSLFLPMENDEVKQRQLMEVALLNGTFRPLPNQPIPPLTRPPPMICRPSLVSLRFVE